VKLLESVTSAHCEGALMLYEVNLGRHHPNLVELAVATGENKLEGDVRTILDAVNAEFAHVNRAKAEQALSVLLLERYDELTLVVGIVEAVECVGVLGSRYHDTN
jgi:hypothetical protein